MFTPGTLEDMQVVALPPHQLRVGVLICYDVEFPEPARVLAMRGAQLLAVPTALPAGNVGPTLPSAPDPRLHTLTPPRIRAAYIDGVHIPRRTVPTRAAENHLFVAYSNFPHEQNLHNNPHHIAFAGQSGLIGPDGEDLERCNANESRLLVHSLHFGAYHDYLARNPYWHDRRPELYADVLKTERS